MSSATVLKSSFLPKKAAEWGGTRQLPAPRPPPAVRLHGRPRRRLRRRAHQNRRKNPIIFNPVLNCSGAWEKRPMVFRLAP